MTLIKDLKNSEEYENLKEVIGKDLEVEKKVMKLCGYAYEMGKAQGHYEATGDWEY